MVLKKYKFLICILMIFSVLLPIFLASFTINIDTLSSHRVSVIIRDEGKLTSLESFHKDTAGGKVVIESTLNKGHVDLLVTLKKDGKTILNEKFSSMATNQPIYITLIPGKVKATTGLPEEPKKEEPAKTTPETTTPPVTEPITTPATEAPPASTPTQPSPTEPTTNEKKEDNLNTNYLTGFITKGKDLIFSKNTLYIIGIIAAIVGVIMMITYFKRKINLKKQPYLNFKMSKFNVGDIASSQSTNKRLAAAEKKLKEAQEEINDLKNRDARIKEVEERFKRDKAELDRLRGY